MKKYKFAIYFVCSCNPHILWRCEVSEFILTKDHKNRICFKSGMLDVLKKVFNSTFCISALKDNFKQGQLHGKKIVLAPVRETCFNTIRLDSQNRIQIPKAIMDLPELNKYHNKNTKVKITYLENKLILIIRFIH